jgi:hypothetical protein
MAFLELTLIPEYRGFLLAVLPPGGFLALGFMLAGKRLIDARSPRSSGGHRPQARSPERFPSPRLTFRGFDPCMSVSHTRTNSSRPG